MLVAVVLTLTLAAFIQGFLGFGSAALTVTLLSLQLPTHDAVGQAVSIAPVSVITSTLLQRRQIAYRGVLPLAAITLLFFPVGVVLLYVTPEAGLRVALGVVIVYAAASQLLSSRVSLMPHGRVGGVIASVLSGLFGGGIGVPGLTMTAYLYGRFEDTSVARASLQFFFLFTMSVAFVSHLVAGTITQTTLVRALVAALPVTGAILAGLTLARRLPADKLRPIYAAALGVLGVYAMIRAVL
jgi:hypothetical protein